MGLFESSRVTHFSHRRFLGSISPGPILTASSTVGSNFALRAARLASVMIAACWAWPGFLYASLSLSHASLLLVGVRACKVLGESRFAGPLVFTILTQHAHRR
jgi:hypothetical protein